MLLIPFSHTVFVPFFRKMRKLSQLSFQTALGCCRICDLNFLSLFFFLPCLLQFLLHASRPFNFRLEFLSFHYGRKFRILSKNYCPKSVQISSKTENVYLKDGEYKFPDRFRTGHPNLPDRSCRTGLNPDLYF